MTRTRHPKKGRSEQRPPASYPSSRDNRGEREDFPLSRYRNEDAWSRGIMFWSRTHPELSLPPEPVEE